MAIIGNPIVSTDFPVDYFSGNGSTTAFTLSIAPASVNAVDVEVSGVSQSPQTYTLSGTTLTFSAAPPSGTNNIVIKHRGIAGSPNVPSAASVTSDKLATQTSIPFATSSLGAGNASIMKNRIINGAMVIDQRNAGVSISANDGLYPLDRFKFNMQNNGLGTGQQVSDAPTGFTKSLKFTSTAATTVGVNDTYGVLQNIEGYNIADLGWGTADAKTVTLSFWVKSSLTGTFGGIIKNNPATRNYAFTYSISSTNTWEYKSVIIAGDTSGTWQTGNGVGMQVVFGLANGSGVSISAGSWQASNNWSATGAVQVLATNGATWQLTGLQLEVGSSATGYEYRQYGQELALCQRYFEKSYDTEVAVATATGNGSAYQNSNGLSGTVGTGQIYVSYRTTKRTQPTITMYSPNNGASGVVYQYSTGNVSAASQQQGQNSFVGYSTGLGLSGNTNFGFQWTASAEL